MNLEALANIGETVGAVAVVVSLVYLVIQLRQNTRSIRSATYQSIVANAATCNQSLTQNKQVARLMRLGSADPSLLDEDEQVQFSFLCMQFFDIFENLYLQYVHGVLDDDYWQPRRASFLALFDSPGFTDRWSAYRLNYSGAFREVVETGLAALRADRSGSPIGAAEPGFPAPPA